MSALNNSLLLGAEDYQISRSLRFNAPDSASLSRSVGTASNRTTWTWAGWVKRSGLTANGQVLFAAGSGLNNNTRLGFSSDDRLILVNEVASVSTTLKETAAVYRDPGAWMHVVCAVDTNKATAGDRVRLYVNGSEITVLNASNAPSLGLELFVNSVNTHYIGQSFNPAYASFYLADIHFVDGQYLAPTAFGQFDANNVWQPKAYTGSYGANGFRLDFSDNSAATATTLGKDRAGSNNWTPNNLSVTAGAGNDSLVDSPTSYGTDTGAGGGIRGNYATWNPLLMLPANMTSQNGNLEAIAAGNDYNGAVLNIPITVGNSGKWYVEFSNSSVNTTSLTGFGLVDNQTTPIGRNTSIGYIYLADGNKRINGSSSSYGSAHLSGDIIGVAVDEASGVITCYRNGASQGTLITLSAGLYQFMGIGYGTSSVMTVNAGQRPFAYTAPSGFKALCTANLPTPTIANGATAMDVKLYTGNGSTQTISGLNFSPDFAWIKQRSSAEWHVLSDTVRGSQKTLFSNSTTNEDAAAHGITFSGNDLSLDSWSAVNANGQTYVAWAWDAGGSTVTNASGSITSQVRANASAGFSIATFTSSSLAGTYTVGHGLNVKPSMTILKARSNTDSWFTWHIALGDNPSDYLALSSTIAETSQANMWGSVGRTSTVCGFASQVSTFASTDYVMYNFAPVAGYSAFGSYTGNGSTDGPFVYTGFRPRWIMFKQTTAASATGWWIYDAVRQEYNSVNRVLFANDISNEGDSSLYAVDLLSNGFKLRSTRSEVNASAGTYIYAAFAESPFQYSRAR